jgi:glycosyltransferase involved in cell wall biosynthesis
MELKEDQGLRNSYDIACERFSRVTPEAVQPKREKAFESIYDDNLFVPCDDDHSEHMVEPEKPQRVFDMNSDILTTVEDVEPLTFPRLPEPEEADFKVKVHYTGPMFDYGGYAKMNRTIIFGLRDRGALVRVQPMESITNVNKKTEEALRSLQGVNISKKYPKVFAMTVPDLLAHGGKKILYTMMETSHRVHKDYADRLNLADEVWTPTTWCRDVFKASGVHPPVHVMPLGVDTERYRPGLDPIDFGPKVRGFKFLSASGWSYRKGFDILVRAYLEEFSNKDDTTLIISSRYAGGLSKKNHDHLMSDFKAFRGMVKKTDGNLPHIVLHSTYTPEVKMPNLYNSADCFVLISRGEGWGLPYCEAAACGLPVIASDHGGQKDFLTNENSFLVPPSGYFESKREDSSYKNMAWISHFYENQMFPDYEGESFELVKKHMRYVYENYEKANEKAVLLRKKLVTEFDWSDAVDKIYTRLGEICEDIDGATK